MPPRNTLLVAILAVGAVIGWSLQRARGAWSDYQDVRGRVPRARARFRSHVGALIRWGIVGIVVVLVLLRV